MKGGKGEGRGDPPWGVGGRGGWGRRGTWGSVGLRWERVDQVGPYFCDVEHGLACPPHPEVCYFVAAAVADRRVVHKRAQRTAVNGAGVVHGSSGVGQAHEEAKEEVHCLPVGESKSGGLGWVVRMWWAIALGREGGAPREAFKIVSDRVGMKAVAEFFSACWTARSTGWLHSPVKW